MDEDFLLIPDVVPVFPLPHVVLFPHTILPLHIEEPRYREMMSDVLAGARIIATALLKPGFEPLYFTRRAPIHSTLGLGQLVESEQGADGNYNVLLRGVGRAIIVSEVTDLTYRQARVESLETFCSADDLDAAQLRRQLFAAVRGNPALEPELRKQWLTLRRANIELDALADLMAAGIPIEPELQQVLLEEPDAFARARLLLDQVRTLAAIARAHLRIRRPGEHNLN